jgi:acetoin utilization protein AcuB
MHERKDKWSVGQWMTQNPDTIKPETSVKQAFFKMRLEGYRHLPVVDEDGKLVGVVTDRDLRRPDVTDDVDGWDEFYQLGEDYEVQDIMTRDLQTLATNDTLEKAVSLFIEHKYGALPVLNKHGELIGILSSHDVLKSFELALKNAGTYLRKLDS